MSRSGGYSTIHLYRAQCKSCLYRTYTMGLYMYTCWACLSAEECTTSGRWWANVGPTLLGLGRHWTDTIMRTQWQHYNQTRAQCLLWLNTITEWGQCLKSALDRYHYADTVATLQPNTCTMSAMAKHYHWVRPMPQICIGPISLCGHSGNITTKHVHNVCYG